MVNLILPVVLWGAALLTLFIPTPAEAQIPTQSIRGQVTDAATGEPVPGVTVMVLDQEPVLGTTTDLEGIFLLEEVPAGRHDLRFSYVGYETRFFRDQLVTSAREVVLSVTLSESVTELTELVGRPTQPKDASMKRRDVRSAPI